MFFWLNLKVKPFLGYSIVDEMVPNEKDLINKFIEFQTGRQKELEQLCEVLIDWASQFQLNVRKIKFK